MGDAPRRASRIGLEFLLIVAGVLTALGVDASWQRHTDRVREEVYLGQLRSDALDNRRRLEEALLLERGQLERAGAMLGALRAPRRMDYDSADIWMNREPTFPWYSDPRLSTGTMVALVETGDINIIRDSRVRSATIAYLGQLEADLAEFSRGITPFQDHSDRLYRLMELGRPIDKDLSGDHTARALVTIQGIPEAAVVMRLMRTNITWRIWYVDQMLQATNEFIAVLQ